MVRKVLAGSAVAYLFLLGLALSSLWSNNQAPIVKHSSSTIAITADGATLLVVNPDSNSLTLVETAGRAVLAEIPVGVDPRSVAVSPDGGTAYVANQGSDSLSVVDVTAGAVITAVAVGDRPVGVAVSPDGRFVAVAELGADRVRLLDAATLSTLSVLSLIHI